MNKNKVVAILSIFYNNWNFGGMLQGYALSKVVNEMGYIAKQLRVSLVDQECETMKDRLKVYLSRYKVIADFLDVFLRKYHKDPRNIDNFRRFQNMEVPCAGYYNAKSIYKANWHYDCFITGSDQVWNAQYFGSNTLRMYGLVFADKSKKKIAYAASIGSIKSVTKCEHIFREFLSKIDYISVREYDAKEVLRKVTDKRIDVMLDPTLLLTCERWEKVAILPQVDFNYVFAYFLNEKNNRHHNEVQNIAEHLQLPLLCIADELNIYTRNGDKQILDAGPKEFIGYIRNANIVLTNSFHGVLFSVIFHKKFWVYKRYKDSDSETMNSRITNFLKEIGLEYRLIDDEMVFDEKLLKDEIDYTYVDKILDAKRANSLQWLKNSLSD